MDYKLIIQNRNIIIYNLLKLLRYPLSWKFMVLIISIFNYNINITIVIIKSAFKEGYVNISAFYQLISAICLLTEIPVFNSG